MNISSLSINRPVLATVISILIILFGAIGFVFLGVREYPSVDPPVVTVTTNYVGANADVIESQITEPLEESINGIAGIRSLTSVSTGRNKSPASPSSGWPVRRFLARPRFEWQVQGMPPMSTSNSGSSEVCSARRSDWTSGASGC